MLLVRYKFNPSESCTCCCLAVDSMNCCNSQLPYQYPKHASADSPILMTATSADEASFNPRLYDNPQAVSQHFPTRTFIHKRVSRLAPIYYFTNLLASPLAVMAMGVGFFVYTGLLSLFLLTSWLLVVPINGVLWTISTMSFFYCMFPHIIVRLQRLHTAVDFR